MIDVVGNWAWVVGYLILWLFTSRAYWIRNRPTVAKERLEDLSFETFCIGLFWPVRWVFVGLRWFFNSKLDKLAAREEQYQQSLKYWKKVSKDPNLTQVERDLAVQNLNVLKDSRGES